MSIFKVFYFLFICCFYYSEFRNLISLLKYSNSYHVSSTLFGAVLTETLCGCMKCNLKRSRLFYLTWIGKFTWMLLTKVAVYKICLLHTNIKLLFMRFSTYCCNNLFELFFWGWIYYFKRLYNSNSTLLNIYLRSICKYNYKIPIWSSTEKLIIFK